MPTEYMFVSFMRRKAPASLLLPYTIVPYPARRPPCRPQFNGQHPLRERAAKLDQGILVVRFEVMFDIWCGQCGELISTGRRFNADKQAVGSYHSTKIWQFTFRHHCGCKVVIQSDPKNTQYLVVEGGRRKVESFDAKEAGTWELPDEVRPQA